VVSTPKPAEELRGLVYSLTPKPEDPPGLPWYQKPALVAVGILAAITGLNLLFW
jgi:SSS family solute:Na+ symporter